MIGPVWEQHAWVFDLVSDDELRRRRARKRALELDDALIAANRARNDVYWRAGATFTPTDPQLATEMEQAQARFSAAHADTFHAPISAYLDQPWHPSWRDRAPMLEPFALLYLEWELTFTDEWRQTAGAWGSPCGTKDLILKTMAAHGVSHLHSEAVEKLLLSAVRGPYRAKDWHYARIARHLDRPHLREALRLIAAEGDELAALRAQFVLSRLENPELSANRRSYGNWLKERVE
jgi:hypothetical protein